MCSYAPTEYDPGGLEDVEIPFQEAFCSTCIRQRFREFSNGCNRVWACCTSLMRPPALHAVVKPCDVLFGRLSRRDALQGGHGGGNAVSNTTAPSACFGVPVHAESSCNIDTFTPDVGHEFSSGIGIQVDQGGVTVVEVETTVTGEGHVEMVLLETKLRGQKIRPKGPGLLLDQRQHARKITVRHAREVIAVKVEDEVGSKPLLVCHFCLERPFPVGGGIEARVGWPLHKEGADVLHVNEGLVAERSAFSTTVILAAAVV